MSRVKFIPLATNISQLYGLFVAIGGIIGYIQAQSIKSLYGGVGAGVLAIVSSQLCKRGYLVVGLRLLLAVCLALVLVFHQRYRATGAFWPTGFMAINSGVVGALALLGIREVSSLTSISSASKQQ